jgi:hypothetical protein
MSQKPLSRSRDLKRLRDEGYDLEIRSGYLLVKDVPYVNSRREVKRGILVSTLTLAGDVTTTPDNHVAYFIGDHPCRSDGTEIDQIKNPGGGKALAEGLVVTSAAIVSVETRVPRLISLREFTYGTSLTSKWPERISRS